MIRNVLSFQMGLIDDTKKQGERLMNKSHYKEKKNTYQDTELSKLIAHNPLTIQQFPSYPRHHITNGRKLMKNFLPPFNDSKGYLTKYPKQCVNYEYNLFNELEEFDKKYYPSMYINKSIYDSHNCFKNQKLRNGIPMSKQCCRKKIA